MPEILIIRPRGIFTNKVCVPLELQVKRVLLRASLCVQEHATVTSCSHDCPCFSLAPSFAILRQEGRNPKRASYSQLQKKASAGKEA